MQKDIYAKLPHLQGYFWCLKWCASISTERLYDRYWQNLQDLHRTWKEGEAKVHSHLRMMAAPWKNPSYSIPFPRKGELIILRVHFVGLFFFQKEQNAFLCPNRCPYFSQSSLTAVPVHVAVFSCPSSPGCPQKSTPCTLLQTWQPPAALTIIPTQNSQGRTRSPPSSQPLTCPCRVQGSGSLSLFSLLSHSQQPC